jgi:hypothetical protein
VSKDRLRYIVALGLLRDRVSHRCGGQSAVDVSRGYISEGRYASSLDRRVEDLRIAPRVQRPCGIQGHTHTH